MTAAGFRAVGQMVHLPPMPPAPPLIRPERLQAFVDPLPIPGVAKGAKRGAQILSYRIPIQEFYAKIHRDVPSTRFWGYGGSVPGPTIEARSGEKIVVEWQNQLPA